MAGIPLAQALWSAGFVLLLLRFRPRWVQFGVARVLTATAVVCLGWVEDVAAKRRPRLLP